MTLTAVPATDENILALEELLEDQLPPWSGCANTLRSLIARIRSEREQAVRECAEMALAMPKLRQLSPDHVAANTPQDVALAILSLSQVSAKK